MMIDPETEAELAAEAELELAAEALDADGGEPCEESEPNDGMDGDAASALASAGFGTDEDYGDGCGGDD